MIRNQVKLRREQLGITQAKLAAMIGVAAPSLSKVEHGEIKPWPKLRHDLSVALTIKEDTLFYEDTHQVNDSGREQNLEHTLRAFLRLLPENLLCEELQRRGKKEKE